MGIHKMKIILLLTLLVTLIQALEMDSNQLSTEEIPGLKTPDVNEEKESTVYYMIRHARSNFNDVWEKVQPSLPYESAEVQAIKGDRDLVDPDLHPIGV